MFAGFIPVHWWEGERQQQEEYTVAEEGEIKWREQKRINESDLKWWAVLADWLTTNYYPANVRIVV